MQLLNIPIGIESKPSGRSIWVSDVQPLNRLEELLSILRPAGRLIDLSEVRPAKALAELMVLSVEGSTICSRAGSLEKVIPEPRAIDAVPSVNVTFLSLGRFWMQPLNSAPPPSVSSVRPLYSLKFELYQPRKYA